MSAKTRAWEDLARAQQNLRTEREWMADHGGNLTGYIARYGSIADEEHHGDGGEAIYAADLHALVRAETRVAELRGRLPKRPPVILAGGYEWSPEEFAKEQAEPGTGLSWLPAATEADLDEDAP